jgi:hypothetical protein
MAASPFRPFPAPAVAAVILAAACHHGGRPEQPRPTIRVAEQEFVLKVVNHHWLDVDVFILHNGQRTHVGTITATASQTIILPAHLLGASRQIALVADAIGSPAVVRSETLLVQPGQIIEWTLETDLRRSSVGVY